MKIKILSILLLCCAVNVTAQQTHMSREAYRARVEAYSQVLKQQKLKTMASSEALKVAKTGFLPSVELQGDGTINLKELDAFSGPAGQYRTYTYKGMFVVGQPLYNGGALNAQKNISKADLQLNELATEMTMDQIHYQSDAYYWSASAARSMLNTAIQYKDIVEQQYNIIEVRFADGAISRSDLLMISTRLKEAEFQLIRARQNYTLALQKLNILMGITPDAPVDSLCDISVVCEPVTIMNLEEVLERRPEYASTFVDIYKSEQQRKAAISKYNPKVNMYVSGGWSTMTPNMGYDVSFTPVVGLNVSVPIFNWGARFKTNRQQKAYVGIQKLQQSYVVDNINEELSAAVTNLTETSKQVTTAESSTSIANENLDLATYSYNEGKASMVDVLSAQLSWIQAETNLINAQLAAKLAVADYRRTISE